MTINAAESPQGFQFWAVGVNKFLGRGDHRDCKDGHVGLCWPEGHRGLLLARHKSGKEAVVLAITSSLFAGDGVAWGRLYLVREGQAGHYPQVVKRVNVIPDGEEWDLAKPAHAMPTPTP